MTKPLTQALQEHRFDCLDWLSVCDYSPRTIHTYNLAFSEFFRWVDAQAELREISDLTLPILQSYMIFLSLRGSKMTRKGRDKKLLSTATKQGHIAALTKFFEHLVKRGVLLTNPTRDLERPRARRTLPRSILSVEEMLKILAGVKGTDAYALRNRAALELLYSTGIRRGELEQLTLESLRLGEQLILINGKGNRERLVPIGREALRTLNEYLEYGRPYFDAKGTSALFLSYRKGPLSATGLLTLLKRLAKEAGISKPVDLHSIRHTCATHMLQNGADIRHIQEMLGHATLQTTQIYTRVETSDLRKMLNECHPREKF